MPFDLVQEKIKQVSEKMPKCRYSIVEIFGDYYYKEENIDKAMKTSFVKLPSNTLKDENDINKFISDNLNDVIPLN